MEIAFAVEWPHLTVVTKIYLAVVALKNTLQKKKEKNFVPVINTFSPLIRMRRPPSHGNSIL